MRTREIVLFGSVLVLTACGGDEVASDASTPAMDAGARTDAAEPRVDAQNPGPADAGAGADAGAILDAGAVLDAGSGADARVPSALGRSPDSCGSISLLAPSLPAEAGHYAAKVLTPTEYPFAVDGIRYLLVRNREVASCSGAPAHRVLLFALDADDPLPANPSADGLGYREYEVPSDPASEAGREVELSVPVPLILTEGQRVVVGIQFAVEAERHPCIADCDGPGAAAGIDWWSNAADEPFSWQDLVADFSLDSQLLIQVTGTVYE